MIEKNIYIRHNTLHNNFMYIISFHPYIQTSDM